MPTVQPDLVHALRGGIVESFHRGALAIVDADGHTVLALGDVQRPVFPRSACKVMQALPLVASGAAFVYWRYIAGCDRQTFSRLETSARLQRLGVWSVRGGIPRPWDVRRGGGL